MLVRVRAGRFTFKLVARENVERHVGTAPTCLRWKRSVLLLDQWRMVAVPAFASGCSDLQTEALRHELNSGGPSCW